MTFIEWGHPNNIQIFRNTGSRYLNIRFEHGGNYLSHRPLIYLRFRFLNPCLTLDFVQTMISQLQDQEKKLLRTVKEWEKKNKEASS